MDIKEEKVRWGNSCLGAGWGGAGDMVLSVTSLHKVVNLLPWHCEMPNSLVVNAS